MARAYMVENSTSTTMRALNYTPEVERLRKLSKSRETIRLGGLLRAMGPAFGRVFIRYDCSPEHGEELLAQSDMFSAEPQGRIIRGDALRNLEDHRIHKWQVLLAGAGTLGENELYGRSIIADGRLEGKIVGPDANVLVFQDPGGDESLFAYAFLCSGVGIRAVRSTSYGTKLLRHRQDILSDLPIPRADGGTTRRVADQIRLAVANREKYLEHLRLARSIVGGLDVVQTAEDRCRVRRARCISWSEKMPSMMAWNYASAGGAPELLRRSWQARLSDVLAPGGLQYGPRATRRPCTPPHGVLLASQRDVFMVRGVGQRVWLPDDHLDQMLCSPGTLIAGGRGQMSEGSLFGRVEYWTGDRAHIAVTEDALRLNIQSEHRELAFAFLSTTLGMRLMRTAGYGTSIPKMSLPLLRDLPFPEVPDIVSAQIRKHVLRSVEAKEAATEAENEAIRIIENEVLPEWL